MSSIGTGIAAGVAAVHQTARQTARTKDIARNTTHRVAADNRDEFVERLASAAAAGDPDAELPDHQAPGYEQLYLHDADGQPLADPTPRGEETDAETHDDNHVATIVGPDGKVVEFHLPPEADSPLYRHLDIRA